MNNNQKQNIGRYEYIQVNITDLLLNPENPRFEPVTHQAEAIQAMVEDQGQKLLNLARDIVINGLSPIDFILVQPIENNWLVREGNRRVTALKLLNQPDLIPKKYHALKKNFKILSEQIDFSLFDNIVCVVLDEETDANRWIQLKHTGENSGVGTVSWDGQQTERFRSYVTGKKSKHLAFLDLLRDVEDIPSAYRDNYNAVSSTNLARLLGDPDVRALLGITANQGQYSLVDGVNPYLLEVLKDLTIGGLKVGTIYDKDSRKNYLYDIEKRVEKASNQPKTDRSENEYNSKSLQDAKEKDSSSPIIASPRRVSYPLRRKTLIPRIHVLPIHYPRVLEIFRELKSLSCFEYSNAASVLFRVFVELSLDAYIKNNTITGVNAESDFSQKVERVMEYMRKEKIMTQNELRPITHMGSKPKEIHSYRTFHSYVHNIDVIPAPEQLLSAWDSLWPFICKLWE